MRIPKIKFTVNERKQYRMRHLAAGGFWPLVYDWRLQDYAPGPIDKSWRVRCPFCDTHYQWNQGAYQMDHLRKKHGLSFIEALSRVYAL